MTTQAPPSGATPEVVAPERYREGGSHLPRKLRDEVARRFIAAFPGMTGATAVAYAKSMIANPNGFMARLETDPTRWHMSPERIFDLMTELPLGLTRPRSVVKSEWRVAS